MKKPRPIQEDDCYTIPEFCRSHKISKTLYYRLKRAGIGPDEIRFEYKVLISKEEAARWRKQRTAASKAA